MRSPSHPSPRAASLSRALSGARLGAVFGMLAATIEVGLWTVGQVTLGTASPTSALLASVGLATAWGAVLGVASSPLLRGRRGPPALVVALCAAWAAQGVYAERVIPARAPRDAPRGRNPATRACGGVTRSRARSARQPCPSR